MRYVVILLLIALTVGGCSLQRNQPNAEPTFQPSALQVPPRLQVPDVIDVPAVSANDHVRGSVDAPVTIIVYSDFECLFCASLAAGSGSLAQAREMFGEQIRVVFRHYILPFHAQGFLAAQAGECARDQDAFWPMHDKLFQNGVMGSLSAAQYKKNAQTLGLNEAIFADCFDSGKYSATVREAVSEAENIGIRSVPTLFVNGRQFIGALPFADYQSEYGTEQGLRSIIEEALQKLEK